MNQNKHSEKTLSGRELLFAYPSIIIGVSVLTLPSDVAKVTSYSDGWVSLLAAGIIATFLAVLALRVALHYPNQHFIDYASHLVTRPLAILISLSFVIIAIVICGFVIRSVAYIAQLFLFDRTPLAVLALAFLLVVIYAVSGSRVGIFRLNMLFLPIILFVFLFVGLFNISWLDHRNYLPLLTTNVTGYFKGILVSSSAFTGAGIALFYTFLVKQNKSLTKQVTIGVSIATIFYIFIFLVTIGVFSNIVTSNLMFPTLELAKRLELPGSIFERIDALVYTIWIMAIFNTVSLFLDLSVLLLTSIFKKVKKQMMLFVMSPIILIIGLFPRDIEQVNKLMDLTMYTTVIFTPSVIIILYILTKIKGANLND